MTPLFRDPPSADWEGIAFSEYCTEPGDSAHSDGDRCWQQRMVRKGDWKLIYYHGTEPQLFNLAEDPRELADAARHPSTQSVRKELLALVLDGWDPNWVEERIREIAKDQTILRAWARNATPPESYRWDLRSEWDYLDAPQT